MNLIDAIINRPLIREARNLASEQGENPEYDRALVELVSDVSPDLTREQVERLILSTRGDYYEQDMSEVLYEKCLHCHLFVDVNSAHVPGRNILAYVHLHRDDPSDRALDESHDPEPSGRRANLLTWKTYGPLTMRERFTS